MDGHSRLHIGTSGWSYKHWKGPFYPEDIADKDLLRFYFRFFHTVEINNSFYRLPNSKTFENWRDRAPEGFIFSVKASRYITHVKKLNDPREPVSRFFERAAGLGEKLGPVLFQLPPNLKMNPEKLAAFLDALPPEHRYTFEFRDATWFDEKIYKILRGHNAAFCIFELGGRTSPHEVTADFVYIRLHGPEGPYQGSYDEKALSGWARSFERWTRQKKDVYCYFDNDQAGFAAQNAVRLNEMTGAGRKAA